MWSSLGGCATKLVSNMPGVGPKGKSWTGAGELLAFQWVGRQFLLQSEQVVNLSEKNESKL